MVCETWSAVKDRSVVVLCFECWRLEMGSTSLVQAPAATIGKRVDGKRHLAVG